MSAKPRYVVLTVGAGEVALAHDFGAYALSHGRDVTFIAPRVTPRTFERLSKLSTCLPYRGPEETRAEIERIAPDVLCCSSAITTSNLLGFWQPPTPKPCCVSLDAHWLWNDQPAFKSPSWFDLHIVPFPRALFDLGLAANGGAFHLSARRRAKIFAEGFLSGGAPIPDAVKQRTRRAMNVADDDTWLFVYLGQQENQLATDVIAQLDELLADPRRRILWKLTTARMEDIPQRERITAVSWIHDFDAHLAAADMAVMHNAHATLPKALRNQTPVVVVTPTTGGDPNEQPQAAEMAPYERLGVCRIVAQKEVGGRLATTVTQLLAEDERDAMVAAQGRVFRDGREAILTAIESKL